MATFKPPFVVLNRDWPEQFGHKKKSWVRIMKICPGLAIALLLSWTLEKFVFQKNNNPLLN